MAGCAYLVAHGARAEYTDTLDVFVCSGLPQMGPSAGQALLNQLRSAAQPQPQGRPDQLTSAGAALLAQLQAASRNLQPPQQQQPNLAQQPNAAGANLLAQLQARSLAQQQQQQAMPQAAGLTNPGMNLLAQLQRVSGGLPSAGRVLPRMHQAAKRLLCWSDMLACQNENCV